MFYGSSAYGVTTYGGVGGVSIPVIYLYISDTLSLWDNIRELYYDILLPVSDTISLTDNVRKIETFIFSHGGEPVGKDKSDKI